MILYLTKQTIERYRIKTPDEMNPPYNSLAKSVIEREQGDRLLEWGGKLFYFDRRKCIQFANFASKLTLFLIDVKVDALPYTGDSMAMYMMDMFSDDKKMVKALETMFNNHPISCFDSLKDKGVIATLNAGQRFYLGDGDMLYNFISDGILHTKELNKHFNFEYVVTRTENGKTIYYDSGSYFRELVMERYG